MTRGVPAMDVIRPKDPELRLAFVLARALLIGAPQLKVLKRLKASTRNSTCRSPLNARNFETARSTDQHAGPLRLFRLTFPSVPGAGGSNAAGFSQRSSVPPYGLSRTWLGR